MSKDHAINLSKLKSIADKLGISADDMLSGDRPDTDISQALDCMRLWFAIRTDEGRARALDCLRRIVDDERR